MMKFIRNINSNNNRNSRKISIFINNFLFTLVIINLFSCRSHTSDDSITKSRLREQITKSRQVSTDDLVEQFSAKDDAFKEKVMSQIIGSLKEEIIAKLLNHPKVNELLEKKLQDPDLREKFIQQYLDSLDEVALAKIFAQPKVQQFFQNKIKNDQQIISSKLMELSVVEKNSFKDIKMAVNVKISKKLNKKLAFVDPYIKYQVHSKERKNISCEKLKNTKPYWSNLIALQKSDALLLGIGPQVFDQQIKSCLLFFRLKDTMEKCQDENLEPLMKLCTLQKNPNLIETQDISSIMPLENPSDMDIEGREDASESTSQDTSPELPN